MLDDLRRLVQDVNAAKDLDEALAIIVGGVKQSRGVDVCSVYLNDIEQGNYVLMASDGLNPDAVGRVRLGHEQGLVGLVGERREPVNLKNAANHPNFVYIPETSEEHYHGFLGVPIIHYRKVIGILIAQHRAQRLFAEDEVAFFVTIAAQLAGAISHALASDGHSRLVNGDVFRAAFVQGVRGAPGVAIGTIAVTDPLGALDSVPDRTTADVDAEENRFLAALDAVQKELRASSERMAALLPAEERALFDVFVMLLGSESLVADTVARIRGGSWAPAALRDTIAEHARVFERLEDPYLRARAEDIRGLGRRILLQLQSGPSVVRQWPERCILVGEEISVAQIAEVPVERLVGVASARGSAVSHIAVLAGALGVPAVMGLEDIPIGRLEGRRIVLDGYQGRAYLEPSSTVLSEFERLAREEQEISASLMELRDLPAETPDGTQVPLYVNTGLLADIRPALMCGAAGVGLYRTEFPFMVRQSFPGEDEQCHVYRNVLEPFAPDPVTMRTLDVGGDKSLPYFPVREDNPFLGWRGIRFTLDHSEIFLTQIRAMLRANAGLNNLQILLPLVTTVSEVDEALALLARAHRELLEEGRGCAMVPVGVMVEAPAAVYQAEALAKRVDFLSLGTNDLTQYLLAVDRNNPRVAALYDSLHPAVLQAVLQVVQGARRAGRPVSICGEMAADPAAVPLLLAAGVHSLSMSASDLPRVKWVIRSVTREKAEALLHQALALEDAAAVRHMMNEILEAVGLGGLIRAGK
jgi:phosphotransferase system enzyme I (PtsP)